MGGLKTVSEVCEATGLNRKLLFDYVEMGLVKPTDYKTIGYEDSKGCFYKGHKLYDDEAIIRLQQIAIFRELGLKRSDIKKKMTASNYDSNETLDELLEMLRKKKEDIEEKILVVEQLKLFGIKNTVLKYMSSDIMKRIVINTKKFENSYFYKKMAEYKQKAEEISEQELDVFFKEVPELNDTSSLEDLILVGQKLFELFTSYYGVCGYFVLFGIFLSAEGEGELVKEMNLSEKEQEGIKLFLEQNSENFDQELVQIIVKHYDIIGMEFSDPRVKLLVDDARKLFGKYYGTSNDEELNAFIELMDINPYEKGSSYVGYVYNAMKYWLINEKNL